MDSTEISTREAEVLAAVGRHLSNARIASRLHISVRTVESHVAALLRKLDAPDRHAPAALAELGQFQHRNQPGVRHEVLLVEHRTIAAPRMTCVH